MHFAPCTFFTIATLFTSRALAACIKNDTDTDGLQNLLNQGGEGYVLSLCPDQTYTLQASLNFTNTSQEISTEGYPTGNSRATLVVAGPRMPGPKVNDVGHSEAINGACEKCSNIRIANIQINGNRGDNKPMEGGGNIEIGGANQNQIVEHVRSYDSRGWSCLHIAEGPFSCSNATIRNNDIGPCGSDYFQYWADGISISCANSLVENNHIWDATDGGIVVFGSPGSTIRNNTIEATDRIMLGGINMVDYDPWAGNFSEVLVEGNRFHGGFADTYGNDKVGVKNKTAVIKIGTAIGPFVWWGDGRYGTNASAGPTTLANNVYSGAMVFAIAIAGARDWTLVNNTLAGNQTFSGAYAKNCTTGPIAPHPPVPFLIDLAINTTNITIDNSDQFENGTAGGLTCFGVMDAPPLDEYPYGPNFDWNKLAGNSTRPTATDSPSGGGSGGGGAPRPTESKPSGSSKTLYLETYGVVVAMLVSLVAMPLLSI